MNSSGDSRTASLAQDSSGGVLADHDDDWDDYEEDVEWGFDCGATPDGGCMKAGSEECDWECPYSFELFSDDEAGKDAAERSQRNQGSSGISQESL